MRISCRSAPGTGWSRSWPSGARRCADMDRRALAMIVAAAAPAPNAADVKPYEVEGFRSAKFGMDEAQVKRAIATDFGVKESTITREVNPVDRTTVLSITAKDVLPDIAIARIHYILGYNQKKLFQVVLTWGAGTSETAANNTTVLGGAQELLNYF